MNQAHPRVTHNVSFNLVSIRLKGIRWPASECIKSTYLDISQMTPSGIFYPQRMKRHKHANCYKNNVYHIQQSKDTFFLYKVKAHAGILGNECADAVAKCSAENQSDHDIHINTDAHPHSSIFWPARVETLPQLAYQILVTPANQGLH